MENPRLSAWDLQRANTSYLHGKRYFASDDACHGNLGGYWLLSFDQGERPAPCACGTGGTVCRGSSVEKGDTSHFDALPFWRMRRCIGVVERGVKTECAGRITVTHTGISVRTAGSSQPSRGIPLLDQYDLVPRHERVIPPLMSWPVLCEVVLAYTIVIVDFEDHQVITRHGLPIAQCQRAAHYGRVINIAPHVDEGKPLAIVQSTRHDFGGQKRFTLIETARSVSLRPGGLARSRSRCGALARV